MTTSAQSKTLIENLRSLLDDADEELMVALAYRCWLAKAIESTRTPSITNLDYSVRDQRAVDRAMILGEDLQLSPNLVLNIYKQLFNYAKGGMHND